MSACDLLQILILARAASAVVYWNPGDAIFRHDTEFAEVKRVLGDASPPIDLVRVRVGAHSGIEDEILFAKQYASPDMDASLSGNRMDIFRTEASWVYAMKDSLYDLTEVLGSRRSLFDPRTIEAFTVDGKLLAIPSFLDMTVLYYRADLLEKYGLGVPQTWNEMEVAARTIQAGERAEGTADFFGLQWQGAPNEILTTLTYAFVASHGGGAFVNASGAVDINNPRAKAAVERVKSWFADPDISKQITPRSVLSQHLHQTKLGFLFEKSAFLLDLTHILGEIHSFKPDGFDVFGCGTRAFGHKTSFTHVPGETWEERQTTAWYWGWSVNKFSPELDEVLRAVDVLASRQQQIFKARQIYDAPTLVGLQNDSAAICDGVADPNLCTLPASRMRFIDRQLPRIGPEYFGLGRDRAKAISPIIFGRMNEYLKGLISSQDLLNLWECQIHAILYGSTDHCESCPPGLELVDAFMGCRLCPVGQAKKSWEREERCSACPRGFAAGSLGMSACLPCLPGMFAEAPGSAACSACPAGEAGNASAQSGCSRCKVGSYASLSNSTSCDACEDVLPGSTTQLLGARSPDDCVCKEGTWTGDTLARCTPCPKGMYCSPLDTRPSVLPGYYARKEDLDPFHGVWRCLREDLCPGGDAEQCIDGQVGIACSRCPDGMALQGLQCQECPGTQSYVPILILFAAFGSCAAAYYGLNKPVRLTLSVPSSTSIALSTALTTGQVLGMFDSLSLPWQGGVASVTGAMSMLVLDPDMFMVGCFVGSGSLSRYTVSFLVPFTALCCFGLLFVAFAIAGLIRPSLAWDVDKTINAMMGVLNGILIVVMRTAMAPMECYKHPNGRFSVARYPDIICDDDGHATLLGMSVMLLLGIIFPFMAAVPWALCRSVQVRSAQRSTVQRFSCLLNRYRPDCKWWCIIFMLRQVLLAFTPMVNPGDASVQLFYMVIVLSLYLILGSKFWPWKSLEHNVLDLVSIFLLMVLIIANAGVMEPSPEPSYHLNFQLACVYLLLLLYGSFVAMTLLYIYKRGPRGVFGRQYMGKPMQLEQLASDWRLSSNYFANHSPEDCLEIFSELDSFDRKRLGKALESLMTALGHKLERKCSSRSSSSGHFFRPQVAQQVLQQLRSMETAKLGPRSRENLLYV
mmetsp:Transcript_33422/g.73108  ORF Transcript_33422/g.73108 Transcript_33422/m.73108 type:complete len:1142 (-) Transcript_33422:241-3666(-)